jgi:hypothetical protein
MDLTQRFKDIAAIENILYPTLEMNRAYSIRQVQLVFDKGIDSVVVMKNSYSFAFGQTISMILILLLDCTY